MVIMSWSEALNPFSNLKSYRERNNIEVPEDYIISVRRFYIVTSLYCLSLTAVLIYAAVKL